MKRINLINSSILSDLLVLEAQNQHFDLHNDFECTQITINKRLILKFCNPDYEIYLIFSNYQIIEPLTLPFFAKPATLDNFYRGRYQQNEELFEEYQQKQCFYLDFMEQPSMSILAKNVYALVKFYIHEKQIYKEPKKTMMNLEKLQNWYIAQTDGDWEHSYGIKIESLDNPAWLLRIDLAETPYENLLLDYKLYENSESDWYALQTKNKVFIGTGDPTKLDFLIQKFFEVIDSFKVLAGS